MLGNIAHPRIYLTILLLKEKKNDFGGQVALYATYFLDLKWKIGIKMLSPSHSCSELVEKNNNTPI